jgi:hypothetical protein
VRPEPPRLMICNRVPDNKKALAYFRFGEREIKSYTTLTPIANVIKFFASSMMAKANRLECLSLEIPSILV